MLLDVASAFHVNVEHHVLALLGLALHLRLQRAIEAIGVNLLVFQELVVAYLVLEFLRREEQILNPVLLGAAWGARGSADGKGEVQLGVLAHQPLHDGALSRPARGGKDYQLASHVNSCD